jgi:DNA-binding XRE family transcriptional regulator
MGWKIFVLEFIDKFFNSSFVAVTMGGFLAGFFGFFQYKKQKVWEIIDKKYFSEGLDGLIKYLGKEREKLEDNYSTCLLIARYFRDLPTDSFLKWIEKENVYKFKLVSSKMPREFFTVNYLLRNRDFKLKLEGLFAKMQEINDYFVSDFIFCIKNYDKKQNKQNYYKKLVDEARSRNKKIEDIYYIIGYLEEILFRIRGMNIDKFKNVTEIKNNKEIINLLEEANEKLASFDK